MNQLTGTRRGFLKSLGLGIAFVGLGRCESALSYVAGPVLSKKRHLERKDKPNVIILLTDDQVYGDLSCHGNPILKTPNLDRLHQESIRFTDDTELVCLLKSQMTRKRFSPIEHL